jgi:hypothetical protein
MRRNAFHQQFFAEYRIIGPSEINQDNYVYGQIPFENLLQEKRAEKQCTEPF